jgi:DNA-binding phage protein
MDEKEKLNEFIKENLEKKYIGISELSKATGINRTTVHERLRRNADWSFFDIIKVAKYLNIKIEKFISLQGE